MTNLFCAQDILECRQYLRVLNGKTATATALILFNLGSLGILGEWGGEGGTVRDGVLVRIVREGVCNSKS